MKTTASLLALLALIQHGIACDGAPGYKEGSGCAQLGVGAAACSANCYDIVSEFSNSLHFAVLTGREKRKKPSQQNVFRRSDAMNSTFGRHFSTVMHRFARPRVVLAVTHPFARAEVVTYW